MAYTTMADVDIFCQFRGLLCQNERVRLWGDYYGIFLTLLGKKWQSQVQNYVKSDIIMSNVACWGEILAFLCLVKNAPFKLEDYHVEIKVHFNYHMIMGLFKLQMENFAIYMCVTMSKVT